MTREEFDDGTPRSGPTLPADGTKTRDVLDCFEADECIKARTVANRMDWVAVRNDASAVSPYLRSLEDRGFVTVDRSRSRNRYRKSLVGRILTEMVVDEPPSGTNQNHRQNTDCHEADGES